MNKFLQRLLLVAMAVVTFTASAQEVVKWTSESTELGDGLYRLELRANIENGWHVYDMGPYELGGPVATEVKLEPQAGVTPEGELQIEGELVRVYDDIYEMEIGYYEKAVTFAQEVRVAGDAATVKMTVDYMACNEGTCLPPTDQEFVFELKGDGSAAAEVAPAAEQKGDASIWGYIIEAVLWGFAALLTPCVFPMVPMTVSYFLKGEGGAAMGRVRASLYGFFIVALYTLPIAAIIIITRVVGVDAVTADIFNWLATHWLPNIIFFLVFMVFAASFFGAFEITMPSWLVNKTDEKADTKGLGGIFFLALTLVLVSFSCTGPIVGSVLIKSTSGEFWTPIVTMLAFSLAFALPFTLLALFPSLLKNMPKSGGWLNSVKVVIGFIEVALGMKFLSVADQTYHWGLLDREVYLAIWIVVFALMGLYLLGKLKFSHDSDMPYLGVGRLALSIVVFSFVVYMIPGMWGAPLKALSGYLPPLTSQDFVIGQGTAVAAPNAPATGEQRKYADFLHLPNGLNGFFDLKEAEAYAAKVDKPIFIDFTGHGCVNCREMEQRVWSDPQVMQILANEYVIVALYMDDKTVLPESDWVVTDSGKTLKSLGKINSHYALKNYGVNAQPYYILKNAEGEMLVDPHGYDLEVANFVKFLQDGIAAYKAGK